jgi:hypothetical protein
MGLEEKSRAFWGSRSEYPAYKNIKRRRLHEVNHIVSRLGDMPSVGGFCDVGCGDGALVRCLDEVLEVDSFFCCDISEGLLDRVPKGDRFRTRRIDLNDASQHGLIESGCVVNLGTCLNYVFDDDLAVSLLESLRWERLFVRAVCSEKESAEVADGFSERLGSEYACLYRTRPHMEGLLRRAGVRVDECFRAYPDSIESEFGTRQYMFYAAGR